MKTARFIQMGRLGVVLGLCVACEGSMRSLGDLEVAGAAGGNSQAPGGNGFGGGAVSGGAVSGAAAGGAAVSGGAVSGGAVSGAAVSGAAAGGAGTRVAGAGVAGHVGVPYVQAPTLPIDPTCICSSPDQICNAARQCVPRCDAAGRCAIWLSPRGVVDLFVDGATVFILTAPASDPLGNPTSDGALYRAEYPDGTLTLIAGGLKDAFSILGRYKDATLLYTMWPSKSIIRVTDAGTATSIASDVSESAEPSILGNWVTYSETSGKHLWGIDLDGDLVPHMLVDLDTIANLEDAQTRYILATQVLDDYFWFDTYGGTHNTHWLCYLTRANLALGPICNEPNWVLINDVVAASGNQLYMTAELGNRLESRDITGETQLKLFSTASVSTTIRGATYSDGWLYSVVGNPGQLVRYPTTVGRLPQEVLPTTVARPAFYGVNADNPHGDFAVGSVGLFWFQGVTDPNQPQYLFHSPLPPQPCDAELPCADSTQRCVNGYCAAAP